MFHLQVERSAHDRQDAAVPQVEARGVHEFQQDPEPLWTDLGVQVDYVQVAFSLVSKDSVEQTTAGHEDSLVGSKMLPVNHNDDICQNVPASKPIEVQKDIAGMTSELNAAIRR